MPREQTSYTEEVEKKDFIARISGGLGVLEITDKVSLEGYDMDNERITLLLTGLLPTREWGCLLILDQEITSQPLEKIINEFEVALESPLHSARSTTSMMVEWWILNDFDLRAWMILALEGKLHPYSFKFLMQRGDYEVNRALALNPNLSASALSELATGPDVETNALIAAHKNCPKNLLLSFIKGGNWKATQKALSNPNLDAETIFSLLSTTPSIQALTANPQMKEEWMREIVTKGENSQLFALLPFDYQRLLRAKKGLINNPNLSEDMRRDLAHDKDPNIKEFSAIKKQFLNFA